MVDTLTSQDLQETTKIFRRVQMAVRGPQAFGRTLADHKDSHI